MPWDTAATSEFVTAAEDCQMLAAPNYLEISPVKGRNRYFVPRSEDLAFGRGE